MKVMLGNSSITINGQTYSGRSVSINNGLVTVDGVVQEGSLCGPITVTVNGDAEDISTVSGDITVSGIIRSADTVSGNINCGMVGGDIDTISGDITCGDVNGNVETLSGKIRTGIKS